MYQLLKEFSFTLKESALNLIPILLIIIGFQLFVFQTVPEDVLSISVGLAIVVLGVAFFLMGLEIGVFPLGNSLSNEFLEKRSIVIFTLFGFALGFSASIAEPAIIAVATQAQNITGGQLDAFTLRLIIAVSVGLITAFGILRSLLGWSIAKIIIGGYVLVLIITYFAPKEIVGLAYDSGGVATNVATVPLIVALGIGIASSLQGKSVLKDGFGFVALAAITPMISIQLYGIFALPEGIDLRAAKDTVQTPQKELELGVGAVFVGLVDTFKNLLPIIATILIFQYIVLQKHLPNPFRVFLGFLFLVIGLYAFIVGIKLGLFPVGESIALSLVELGSNFYIYLFAFLIGFGTTMAEPALVAVVKQANRYAEVALNVKIVRIMVALGVGFGILLGTYKIVQGYDIWGLITFLYVCVVLLTLIAPKNMVAFAFDLGGVTTSEITVPIVTAFGVYLATNIEGRNVLSDGFGLIAFASVFPMITVLGYATILELIQKRRQKV
jgi:hypothetical protein